MRKKGRNRRFLFERVKFVFFFVFRCVHLCPFLCVCVNVVTFLNLCICVLESHSLPTKTTIFAAQETSASKHEGAPTRARSLRHFTGPANRRFVTVNCARTLDAWRDASAFGRHCSHGCPGTNRSRASDVWSGECLRYGSRALCRDRFPRPAVQFLVHEAETSQAQGRLGGRGRRRAGNGSRSS